METFTPAPMETFTPAPTETAAAETAAAVKATSAAAKIPGVSLLVKRRGSHQSCGQNGR
jgi:hypothetical protein